MVQLNMPIDIYLETEHIQTLGSRPCSAGSSRSSSSFPRCSARRTGAGSARSSVSRVMVFLGTISYGIYLWHIIYVKQVDIWSRDGVLPHNLYVWFLVILGFTLTTATLSYYLLERPLIRDLATASRSPRPKVGDARSERAHDGDGRGEHATRGLVRAVLLVVLAVVVLGGAGLAVALGHRARHEEPGARGRLLLPSDGQPHGQRSRLLESLDVVVREVHDLRAGRSAPAALHRGARGPVVLRGDELPRAQDHVVPARRGRGAGHRSGRATRRRRPSRRHRRGHRRRVPELLGHRRARALGRALRARSPGS